LGQTAAFVKFTATSEQPREADLATWLTAGSEEKCFMSAFVMKNYGQD